MLRRLALVLAICLFFAGSSTLDARRSGSKGSRRSAGSGQKATSGRTVHAKSRLRADRAKTSARDQKSGDSRGTSTTARSRTPRSGFSGAAARDGNNRIKRSAAAKDAFMRQTGYPHGRPGYVVDHIRPLACGGADAPGNMQWQTIAEARAKDRTERVGCR